MCRRTRVKSCGTDGPPASRHFNRGTSLKTTAKTTIRRISGWTLAYFLVTGLLGAMSGVGAYTFLYAKGASYLSKDAAACANCHIMQSHFDAWAKSSHKAVAACNDCHAPHGSVVEKYACKARNGFWHSLAFTTGDFPEPLRMTQYNREITEHACRDCHSETVHMIDAFPEAHGDESMSCIRCHQNVGHPL